MIILAGTFHRSVELRRHQPRRQSYLSRLKAGSSDTTKKARQDARSARLEQRPTTPEVNLGTFFGHATAVEQSPKFNVSGVDEAIPAAMEENAAHHVALVKLVDPEKLDDLALQGLGLTMSQLCRLSMTPCVVLDCGSSGTELGHSTWRQDLMRQAERLQESIQKNSGVRARILDAVCTVADAMLYRRSCPDICSWLPSNAARYPSSYPWLILTRPRR